MLDDTISEIQNLKNKYESLIEENYPEIRFQFQNPYGLSVLDPIRFEICSSITIGCFQAAITLTNHLLENSLKTFLVYQEIIPQKLSGGAYYEKLKLAIDKYDHKCLYDTIILTSDMELINEPQKKELLDFKEKYRNAFSHAQRRKIFKGEKTEIDEEKKMIMGISLNIMNSTNPMSSYFKENSKTTKQKAKLFLISSPSTK
jgi:hypothetical protein